jgi:hypothetical protein
MTAHYPGLVQALQSKFGLSTQTFPFSDMMQMFSTREHWVLVNVPRAQNHRFDHHIPSQPTISLKMSVPSQGHYGFPSFLLLTDFVCLYTYEF